MDMDFNITPSPFEVEILLPSFMEEKITWPKLPGVPSLSSMCISFDGGEKSFLHLPLEDLIDINESDSQPFCRWLLQDDQDKEETKEEKEFTHILVKLYFLRNIFLFSNY